MPESTPTPRSDLAALVLSSERDLRAALLDDPQLREVVEEAQVASARRDLLLSAPRLTRQGRPDFFAELDRVVERLGIEAAIEAYCLTERLPSTFVTAPGRGRRLLGAIGLVGPEGRLSDGTSIEELGDEEFERRVLGIAEKLCVRLSLERRQKILEDLVAIALADGDLAEAEVSVLGTAAIWLGIDPRFVEEAIARHASTLD